jgi:hypothetical protein
MSGRVAPAKREAYLRSQHRCIACTAKLCYDQISKCQVRCPACVEVAALARFDRNQRIQALRGDGVGINEIARMVGCAESTVRYTLKVEGTRLEKEPPHENAPRCRCGLCLPCNNCIPSIYAFASQRRGYEAT